MSVGLVLLAAWFVAPVPPPRPAWQAGEALVAESRIEIAARTTSAFRGNWEPGGSVDRPVPARRLVR